MKKSKKNQCPDITPAKDLKCKEVIVLHKNKDIADRDVIVTPLITESARLESGQKKYFSNWEVHPAGNDNQIYPPTGYKNYSERLIAFQEGKLKHPEQIYGLSQALEHIQQLRHSVTKGKNPLINAEFEVVEVTIIKTLYKTYK